MINTTGMWTLIMLSFIEQSPVPSITSLFIYADSNWAFYECKAEQENFERQMESLGVPFVYFSCTQEKDS